MLQLLYLKIIAHFLHNISTSSQLSLNRYRAHPDLIVVASLIDKLPNLGGLCRTCEILGVGQYVIPCAKFVEEAEFQSVAVTAHQWTPIQEVTPSGLITYLRKQRDAG